jgi:glycosyltransferase involved in cell wall biosynthesis
MKKAIEHHRRSKRPDPNRNAIYVDGVKVQKEINERIKVALLGGFSPDLGGVATYTNQLIKYLAYRADIELHVVTFGDKHACYEHKNTYFEKGGFDLHVIEKPFGYPLSRPLLISYLRRKITGIKPYIVHSQGSGLPSSTVTALVRDKYPSVLTVFGLIAREYKFRSTKINVIQSFLVSKPNERYAISKIPNIVVESSHNKEIISAMTNSKIYVVSSGVELYKIQGIKPHLSEKSDILFVGRLAKGKGVDILIKALPVILNSAPDLVVHIMGSGIHKEELKNLVGKLGLQNSVKFLGFIPEEEKFQYYKACKVVVIPSRWDFSPITISEAMACGKPVIASTQTNSEILKDGETGLLFESENVEDLANKMLFLLQNDELRKRMGEAALERARDCDWSKVAERHVEIYKEVIADF